QGRRPSRTRRALAAYQSQRSPVVSSGGWNMMEDGRQGASGWWPLAGGLLVAVADALFAWGFWRGRGASLGDIFRSVAAGLYGDAARASEGAGVAWIGAGLHLFIGITMVVAYALVARRWRPLVERPWLCGS